MFRAVLVPSICRWSLMPMLLILPTLAAAQLGSRQFVKASVLPPAKVVPGRSFTLTVRLTIEPGYHIQANDAKDPYIPTRVQVTVPKGYKVGKPVFPRSISITMASEEMAVFEGTVEVKVPITPPAQARGKQRLRVKVEYQACTDEACFPPTETSVNADILIGSPNRKVERS